MLSKSDEVRRQPDGGTATVRATRDKQIGNEIDGELIYDYTEDVQIGLNMGWFMPGDAFHHSNDSTASQAILHANVNF